MFGADSKKHRGGGWWEVWDHQRRCWSTETSPQHKPGQTGWSWSWRIKENRTDAAAELLTSPPCSDCTCCFYKKRNWLTGFKGASCSPVQLTEEEELQTIPALIWSGWRKLCQNTNSPSLCLFLSLLSLFMSRSWTHEDWRTSQAWNKNLQHGSEVRRWNKAECSFAARPRL